MSKKKVSKKTIVEKEEEVPFTRTKKTAVKKTDVPPPDEEKTMVPDAPVVEEKKEEEEPKVVAKTPTDPRVWFQKVGGGSFHARIGGQKRIIKPGERFQALPEEIPAAFKDSIIPMIPGQDIQVGKANLSPSMINRPAYNLRPSISSPGMYDIINASGKIVSEKSETKEVAEQMIKHLMR